MTVLNIYYVQKMAQPVLFTGL